jgi:hypothetical protein
MARKESAKIAQNTHERTVRYEVGLGHPVRYTCWSSWFFGGLMPAEGTACSKWRFSLCAGGNRKVPKKIC